MSKIPANEAVEELTLLLMYLTKFSEKIIPEVTAHRTWKGYNFDVIDALDESGYIEKGSNRSKSVMINEEGLEYAKELLEKYQISDYE